MDAQRVDPQGGVALRRLRLAWTVGCVVVAIPVVIFWLRSRHLADNISVPLFGLHHFSCYSEWGSVQFDLTNYGSGQLELSSEEVGNRGYTPKQSLMWYLGFSWYSWPGGNVLMLPFWLLAGLLLCFALLPWARRFSLRKLLIVITLTSVLFGLHIWTAQF